jgi:hypothetical protein
VRRAQPARRRIPWPFLRKNRCNRTSEVVASAAGVVAEAGEPPAGKDRLDERREAPLAGECQALCGAQSPFWKFSAPPVTTANLPRRRNDDRDDDRSAHGARAAQRRFPCSFAALPVYVKTARAIAVRHVSAAASPRGEPLAVFFGRGVHTMAITWIRQWLKHKLVGARRSGGDGRRRLSARPRLEVLEDRLAPATFTWTGGPLTTNGTNHWTDPRNWSSVLAGVPPGRGTTWFSPTAPRGQRMSTTILPASRLTPSRSRASPARTRARTTRSAGIVSHSAPVASRTPASGSIRSISI